MYSDFRNLYLLLTIEHFVYLQEFIVVKSNFLHRAMEFITFGTINKYLKSRTHFIGNSRQLCSHLKIDPILFMEFIPERLFLDEKDEMPKYDKQPMSVKDQRMNFTSHQLSKE